MTTPYLTPPVFSWPAAPGGKLHTYLAGGTVAQATYSDAAGVTPNTNPVTLDSLGSAVVRLAVGVAYHFVLKDSLDVTTLWDADNFDNAYLTSGTITAAIVGAVLYPQSAGELAAAVTPTNYYKYYGDLTRYGAVCDSTTDCTAALQAALSANASYYPVVAYGISGKYFKVTARVTAPANTHLRLENNAELRWTATTATGTNWLGSATRPGIEVTGDNFLLEGKGKITGPATVAAGSGAGGGGVSAYVSNEFGIMRIGTSAAARGTGFIVRDVEISLWGSNGISTQFVQDIQILGVTIHDVGYAGIQEFSALNCKEYYNKIYGIAPGTSSNAYGITHSHDSTNYSTDPLVGATITGITVAASAVVTISTVSGSNPYAVGMNVTFQSVVGMTQINGIYGAVTAIGGASGAWTVTVGINSSGFGAYVSGGLLSCPRQAANPFCIDMDCAFNEVRDIPLWTALDAHGCYDGRYHHNAVYNCHRAIQISSSSNAGANYAGENNRIEDNVIYGQQINGNATTDVLGYQAGIVINGGSTVTHRGIICARNHLFAVGHANAAPTVFCIEATQCSGAIIEENTFHACVGIGIAGNNSTCIVRGNFWDSVGQSATGSVCISIQTNCGVWIVQGNLHKPLTGTLTVYGTGLTFPGSGNSRCIITGNDFSSCTTPYGGTTTLTAGPSDIIPAITDAVTGSHTIDISVCGLAPRVVILASQTLVATLTSLLNPQMNGQEVTIIMTGSSTLTVNDTGNMRLQGGTAAVTNQSSLTLVWSSSATLWFERSRALGNT